MCVQQLHVYAFKQTFTILDYDNIRHSHTKTEIYVSFFFKKRIRKKTEIRLSDVDKRQPFLFVLVGISIAALISNVVVIHLFSYHPIQKKKK